MKSLLILPVIAFSFLFSISSNQQRAPLAATNAVAGVGNNYLKRLGHTDTVPSYSWSIAGCAEGNDKGSITKNKQVDKSTPTDDPEIIVSGDSISYSRSVTHLCCRQAKVSVYQRDSLLTITEYWYHQGCKCRCSSTVSAVLNKIAKGNYRLFIIEGGTNPLDDKPMMSQDTIWRQPVTIR